MSRESEANNCTERRDYFRLDDQVWLGYRVVDDVEAQAIQAKLIDRVADRFTVAASFATSTRAMQRMLSGLSSGQSDLAGCIKMLDQKLNQLARLFVMEEMQSANDELLNVNLSAGGMVFPVTREFAPGDKLELRFALLPSMIGILTLSRVVYCERSAGAEGPGWQVAVEYEALRESDRDLICSHIISREAEILRQRREEQDNE